IWRSTAPTIPILPEKTHVLAGFYGSSRHGFRNKVSNADMDRLQLFLKYLPDNNHKMDEMKNHNKQFESNIQNYLNELKERKLIL
ncbi:hypothetical protein, partial [Alicyclobacillus cycloheptanicus]|uniref:hypothetical protein n=1 Tax=Alicyclobacillus cycloheptanicus TaxID=1457 RepID=UPI0027D87E57